jgi:Na+-transporting NADH:ubiquinone oxidoreductase subunit C
MKKEISMLLFIVVLGTITSFLLLGMDLLTRDRIKENETAQLKAAVLSASNISFNFTTIHDVFEEEIEIVTVDELTFYINKANNYVSYEFLGGGVWGPIRGIITLEPDFETIVQITILQQEETPGLGGVVAESQYLARFVGIVMVPKIEINKDPSPNKDNEVDAITGATNTSKRFELLLNENYTMYLNAWNKYNE